MPWSKGTQARWQRLTKLWLKCSEGRARLHRVMDLNHRVWQLHIRSIAATLSATMGNSDEDTFRSRCICMEAPTGEVIHPYMFPRALLRTARGRRRPTES